MKKIVLLAFATMFVLGCTSKSDLGIAQTGADYESEVEAFFENRIERLKEPLGWMRLAGMYWLDEGEQSFGGGAQNDIVFPEGYISDTAGTLIFDGETVEMRVAEGVVISVNDEPVRQAVLLSEEISDVFAVHGSLHWTIIRREDLTGIRLYNTENEHIDQFTGFDRFPTDSKYFVNARMIPHSEPTTIPIINVLGQTSEVNSPGRLHFHIDGESYSLIALEGGERMFIIVGDETNRTQTFQGGRYMYIDYPEEGSDITQIDFNLLYNPPCAYNPYTTCQFPPRENIFPIAINAGEKRPSAEYSALGK
jgi:uncharacterized protein (DUF1684 family)